MNIISSSGDNGPYPFPQSIPAVPEAARNGPAAERAYGRSGVGIVSHSSWIAGSARTSLEAAALPRINYVYRTPFYFLVDFGERQEAGGLTRNDR